MSRATQVGLALLGASLILGVLGDALFQGQPLGLNVGVSRSRATQSLQRHRTDLARIAGG